MVTVFPLDCPTMPGDAESAAPKIATAQSVLATKVNTVPLPPSFYVSANYLHALASPHRHRWKLGSWRLCGWVFVWSPRFRYGFHNGRHE